MFNKKKIVLVKSFFYKYSSFSCIILHCMRLRSGKLARNNKEIPKRKYVRKMANQSQPSNQNPPNNDEVPPSVTSTGGTTVSAPSSEAIPSSTSSTPTLSNAYTGPLLTYIGPQGSQETPSRGNYFSQASGSTWFFYASKWL